MPDVTPGDRLVSVNSETLTSVNRALDVLEAFTAAEPEWGLSELSRRLEVGKPTLHRVLRNLEHRGYLRQDPDSKRYRLGYAVLRVSQAAISDTPTEVAQPILRDLAASLGEQTMLWVLDVDHAVCVAKIAGRHALRTHTDLGASEPAMLMASGRCLLADRPDEDLVAFPEATPELLARFAGIRRDGYEISRGDRWPDVNAVASPVRDHRGRIVAALAVSAAATRFVDGQLEPAARTVRGAAHEMSLQLGAP